ncbi:PQQ-binding-like beta-propeller repeat protein [Polyangium aurulentum]|uniref:outer membrane protein assembly factor BamB family protein n=1 Tax=Polyangium aurulentum TaxID=2567896 RepID=UPI0010AE06F8|nr:PQQ-binding-like beta-propeller repeat protein [Polyangium aurulentum]UQA56478.1 PQQ-like beta-propeller repeat protein [Polyangium aurulentum]
MTGLSLVARRPEISTPGPDPSALRALFDLLLDRSEALTNLPERDAAALVVDLAYAVAELSAARKRRAAVRVCAGPEPWELGLERSGRDVLVSLVQVSAVPVVALHERRIDGEALCARVVAALEALSIRSARATSKPVFEGVLYGEAARLVSAHEHLVACLPFGEGEGASEPALVAIEPTGEVPIVMAADVLMRTPAPAAAAETAVQRADLFALLFRGKLRVLVGEHARELPEVFVFLFAEQLVEIAHEALEAWGSGRPHYRRMTVGGAICGVRIQGEDGHASLTIGVPRRGTDERGQTWTFPAVDVGALVQSVVAFGRALSRSVVRRDRAQAQNLRLQAFRTRVRELGERLKDLTRNDSKINDAPEGYRAFAAALRPPPSPEDESLATSRLRYAPRWFAAIPSIDLRATFLCGDALVVGATRELSCLDRRTGELVWTRPVPRAVSVMTPLGLARIEAEGALSLHDIQSGEVQWTTQLAPRAGSSTSGVVVSTPGLPRTLVVSEGARHLAAVDLHGGGVRWRYGSRRGSVFRLRRAGKLLVVASGEPALVALDVLTGEVVWRFCDRRRFASHVAVDQDALFAVSGDGAFVERPGARLHHLDPWSGAARWSIDLPGHLAPVGAPLLAPETAVVVTHGRRGTGLVGFDRATGEVRFDVVACASAASCLLVDGTVILNSEGGELVAIDAKDGSTRYRHVFGSADGDKPRRLEPMLRSGALFVPQGELFVVRPRDGKLLGRVPADLVPDLFRVDEKCDVYVVEESGHIAAFSTGPRLRLV